VDEQFHKWDRLLEEPNRWYQRFERLRLIGPNRSILALYLEEWIARQEKAGKSIANKPKCPPGAWSKAAKEWHWQERWEAWDQYLSDRAAKEAEERRLKILSSGFAQRHERVRKLDELANLLLVELLDKDKRWLADVKQIGSGFTAERVDIVRFNSALIRQFRETLEDLAAEMGERVRGIEIFGKDGSPLLPIADLVAALRQADELIDKDDDQG
jgi:AAA+ ATPase superfamily predicted ATPase